MCNGGRHAATTSSVQIGSPGSFARKTGICYRILSLGISNNAMESQANEHDIMIASSLWGMKSNAEQQKFDKRESACDWSLIMTHPIITTKHLELSLLFLYFYLSPLKQQLCTPLA